MNEELKGQSLDEVNLGFRAKTVYYYFNLKVKSQWRTEKDPVESARKFLREHGSSNNILMLDVPAEPGTDVIAFKVSDVMDKWARNTQELGLDSTCK